MIEETDSVILSVSASIVAFYYHWWKMLYIINKTSANIQGCWKRTFKHQGNLYLGKLPGVFSLLVRVYMHTQLIVSRFPHYKVCTMISSLYIYCNWNMPCCKNFSISAQLHVILVLCTICLKKTCILSPAGERMFPDIALHKTVMVRDSLARKAIPREQVRSGIEINGFKAEQSGRKMKCLPCRFRT